MGIWAEQRSPALLYGKCRKDHIFMPLEKFAFPVVSLIIRRPESPRMILLQRRTKPEPAGLNFLWELPQGRVRQGESIFECAARELQEEAGLSGLVLDSDCGFAEIGNEHLEYTPAFVVSEKGHHSYLAVCLTGRASGEPTASSESSSPTWCTQEEVLSLIGRRLIFPLNIPMLECYYRNMQPSPLI